MENTSMSLKATAFVYKWTHIPSGMWYIGSRTAKNCHINDGYICSSQIVRPMIERNPDDWKREILHLGDSKSMRKKESQLLRLYNAASDPMSFNRSNWGGPVQGSGRKKGQIQKIRAKNLLMDIDKTLISLCGKTFFQTLIEDYANCTNKSIKKDYEKLFFKKQMTITYNGNKIYDYRNYLTE